MKKRYTFIQSLSALLFLISSNSGADIYIRDYYYTASETDSKVTCRENSLKQVKAELLDEVGMLVSHNLQINKDNFGVSAFKEVISTTSLAITSLEILEENWNGVTYYIKVQIDIDKEQVKKLLEDISYKQKFEALSSSFSDFVNKLEKSQNRILNLQLELLEEGVEVNVDELPVFEFSVHKILSPEELFIIGKFFFYSKTKREQALPWLLLSANKENADAQLFYFLLRVDESKNYYNLDQAIYWLKKSAMNSNALASNILGDYYDVGYFFQKAKDKIDPDQKQSFFWHLKAASLGNEESIYIVAEKILNGEINFIPDEKYDNKMAEKMLLGLVYLGEKEVNILSTIRLIFLYLERMEFYDLKKAFDMTEVLLGKNSVLVTDFLENTSFRSGLESLLEVDSEFNKNIFYLLGLITLKKGDTKISESKYYFKKSCKLGYQLACDRL